MGTSVRQGRRKFKKNNNNLSVEKGEGKGESILAAAGKGVLRWKW